MEPNCVVPYLKGAGMNSRIELIDDGEVVVRRNIYRNAVTALLTSCGVVSMVHRNTCDTADFDAEGRDALIDCLQCLRDTGGFAALSDTSNVAFVGKLMRLGPDGVAEERGYRSGMEVTVLRAYPDYPIIKTDLLPAVAVRRCDLLSLTPAPRVRPYTPVEAVAYFGRPLKTDTNGPWHIGFIYACGIRIDENGLTVTYDKLAREWKWADDGSPCGIVEQQDNQT